MITIALIFINIIVFVGLQGDDNKKRQKTIQFYFEKGLGDIELPLYEAYRTSIEKPLVVPKRFKKRKQDRQLYIFFQIEQDNAFQKLMKRDQVVKPDSADYAKWKSLREEFQSLNEEIFTNKYSFVPAEHTLISYFSYMFLHGSFGHLFGNMLFLWLFGCILEIGCGRAQFSATYIATGLFAVLFFWVTRFDSATGLVGASGAIAGLMGAYTVLFGKSRIKLFVYLGFYFNYIRVPAIILLPFWLGRELYSHFFGGPGNVAYTAHIGGIISGAAAGFLILKLSNFRKEDVFSEEVVDTSTPLVEEALTHIGKLEFEKGKALLEQAIVENATNYEAYAHIFNIEKQSPESVDFHKISKRYLHVLVADSEMHGKLHGIYKDYITRVRPKLTPELYSVLSIIFAKQGQVEEAEKIIGMLLKNKPGLPKLPTAILRVAEAFQQKGMGDKAVSYQKVLCSRFPETIEARIVNLKV